MAPNKFEKHLKKQLQEREIKPSASAWRRISEQLEVAEEPKSKRFFRYGIAAGFIGLLTVSIWYFNMDETVLETQTVVTETPVYPVEKEQKSQDVLEEKSVESKVVAKEKPKPKRTPTTITVDSQTLRNAVKMPIVSTDKNNKHIKKVSIISMVSEKLIDTKIAEVIAQVDFLEKENILVTDAEIDALLRKAEQELFENKVFLENDSVDAIVLLAQVENELDHSFRDQIFDALKNGFVRVRTAVADRNR